MSNNINQKVARYKIDTCRKAHLPQLGFLNYTLVMGCMKTKFELCGTLVQGATYYKVYRSDSSKGTFEMISDQASFTLFPNLPSGVTIQVVDDDIDVPILSAGESWWYTVEACNDNGCVGGFGSNLDNGYRALSPPNIDDSDSDGIQDHLDNCPIVSNSNQDDVDNDGLGDLLTLVRTILAIIADTETSAALSVGSGGDIIETDDGKVTMDVPADALDSETTISITDTGTNFHIGTSPGNLEPHNLWG